MQSENPRRLGLVPLHLFQNVQDILTLEVAPGLSQGQSGLLDILDDVAP